MNNPGRVVKVVAVLVLASSAVFAGVVDAPEPASLSLLVAGLVGLGGVAGWRTLRRK